MPYYPQLTSSEQEYYNELITCFETSYSISGGERRILNRLRQALGLSEERANELEKMANPNSLSPEEKEFLNELKTCFENGSVSNSERRLLNRLRISLGITEERADQIEHSLVNK